MSNRHQRLHELLKQDLAELKLRQIAESYREVIDEAARKNAPMLEVLANLMAAEVTVRHQRALERRIRQAKLPPRKTLEDYDFTFPRRVPKQKILRLFDCEFIGQHHCAVLIGRTGTGKPRPTQYPACHAGM
jgi:DNA replication protein DnaC